jgi:hypothetical protein
MSKEPSNYDALRRLLNIKRHEQPPAPYFSGFSEKVLQRIQTRDPSTSLSWWQRWGLDFDFQPATVCAVGVLVAGLLLVGVLTSMHLVEDSALAAKPIAERMIVLVPVVPQANTSFKPHTLNTDEPVRTSTEPVTSPLPASSPFNQVTLRALPVGFNPVPSGK